jgi:hypothetical protein
MSRANLEAEYIRLTQGQLRAEHDGIAQRQEAAQAAEREATERAASERAAAAEAERERIRKAAWVTHFNEVAIEANPDVLWGEVVQHALANTPERGWPASHPESDYFMPPTDADLTAAGDVGETHLGRLAKERGLKM